MTDGDELVTREVSVTQADIDEGKRESNIACPVALAILPHVLQECFASVNSQQIYVFFKDYRSGWHASSPSVIVKGFLNNFDEDMPVCPFTFPLTLPARLWRQTND